MKRECKCNISDSLHIKRITVAPDFGRGGRVNGEGYSNVMVRPVSTLSKGLSTGRVPFLRSPARPMM